MARAEKTLTPETAVIQEGINHVISVLKEKPEFERYYVRPGLAIICKSCTSHNDLFDNLSLQACGGEYNNPKLYKDSNGTQSCSHYKSVFAGFSQKPQ